MNSTLCVVVASQSTINFHCDFLVVYNLQGQWVSVTQMFPSLYPYIIQTTNWWNIRISFTATEIQTVKVQQTLQHNIILSSANNRTTHITLKTHTPCSEGGMTGSFDQLRVDRLTPRSYTRHLRGRDAVLVITTTTDVIYHDLSDCNEWFTNNIINTIVIREASTVLLTSQY